VGIGFAIPSALAQTVIAQLREFGQTRRGWLGVRIQGVTEEIAESFGLDEPKGALIARVNEGEPAEKAGLMAGDVILSFDGKEVSNVRRLQRIVAETPIDKTVKITVWRDEEKKTFDVSVGRLEEFEKTAEAAPGKPGTGKTAKKMTLDSVGLSLSVLVPELRERFELSNEVEGVIVVGVEEQGFASERGMRAGDLIVEVNQVPVVTPEEVKAKIKELVSKKRKTVLFLVERSDDRRFISVPLVEE
jgi:serine protease Do